MARGLNVGFSAQPYTLQCAPGSFNLLGYDAALPNSGAIKGFGMTGLPGAFVLAGQGNIGQVGGTFPAATPTFSPAGATYANAQRVTISCSTTGTASIYYTTDGTTPTTASTPYAGTINVPASATVKAIAIVFGFGQSAVGSAAYVIALNPPAAALALGYTQSQFNIAPQVADICLGPGATPPQAYGPTFKFSNKYYYDSKTGWINPACANMAQGVLSLNNLGGGAYGSAGALVGQMPNSTAGALGYLVALAGFHCEFHEAITDSNADHFEAIALYPQEKINGTLQYLEVDIHEGGYAAGMFSTIISWAASSGVHVNYSNFSAFAIDRTQFHRYGFSYDPIGMVCKFYCDDVTVFTISTNQTDANGKFLDTSIKNYHYYVFAGPQSHANPVTNAVPYSQFISNIQAWIPPAPGTLSIRVAANGTLVNSAGSIVNLRGANIFGMEGTYTNGGPSAWTYGGWQTASAIPPFAQLASTYKWNVFRIPVHLHSVLGLTSYKFRGSDFTGTGPYNLPASLTGIPTVNCDPHGTYMAELKSALDAITAAGCYAIVDMHLWGPQVTIGGASVPIWNSYQNPASWMPDAQAVAGWTKLAGLLKGYPNVIIDLVNEPTYPKWAEWANGASHTTMDYNAAVPVGSQFYFNPINAPWTSVGMVQLLAAVRATGATNVVLLNSVGYAGVLGNSQWITGDTSGATWLSTVQSQITDKQICAGLHAYPNQAFTDPNYFRWYSGDNAPATNGYRQWIALAQSIIAAGYPVIIGEMGGQTQGTGVEPFVSDAVAQVDALNATKAGSVHLLGWSANPIQPPQQNFQLLYYPTGVPPIAVTTDEGKIYTAWTVGHAAP